MSHSTQPTPAAGKNRRPSVRQLDDPTHGRVWRVTYGCACGGHSFRRWHTALIFALNHRCPEAWEPIPAARPLDRGGLQCLRHYLAGWPGGQDCPCVAGGGVR